MRRPVQRSQSSNQDPTQMWGEILSLAGQRLKPSTAMLLTGSTLTKFEDDVLTVEFPATAKPQKEMCESNGRIDQITAIANEYLGCSVRIKFVVAAATVVAEAAPAEDNPNPRHAGVRFSTTPRSRPC